MTVRKKSSKLDLWCKDIRIVKFRFPPGTKSLQGFYDAINKALPAQLDKVFAFAYTWRPKDQDYYWDIYSMLNEIKVRSRCCVPPPR